MKAKLIILTLALTNAATLGYLLAPRSIESKLLAVGDGEYFTRGLWYIVQAGVIECEEDPLH